MAVVTPVRIRDWTVFADLRTPIEMVVAIVGGREKSKKVLGGFEPPSLDSESRVLTVTPQDRCERRQERDGF